MNFILIKEVELPTLELDFACIREHLEDAKIQLKPWVKEVFNLPLIRSQNFSSNLSKIESGSRVQILAIENESSEAQMIISPTFIPHLLWRTGRSPLFLCHLIRLAFLDEFHMDDCIYAFGSLTEKAEWLLDPISGEELFFVPNIYLAKSRQENHEDRSSLHRTIGGEFLTSQNLHGKYFAAWVS